MTMRRRNFCTIAALAAACLAIPALGQKAPDEALKALARCAPGLQITTWATEPQLFKPTNMDIDARGRIWITEGVNYRRPSRTRAEEAIASSLHSRRHATHRKVRQRYKVFVQDIALKSPLGICVLGNKVIVAQSPNMLIYTIDASGDRPVGPPQVIFTGFGGVDHDHGVHSGIFGPDGRYYFNCGNEGDHGDLLKYGNYVKGKEGQPVTDILGSEIGRKASKIHGQEAPKGETAYREGLAMAMNVDASDLEVLGYNFRNNYELAVDSFGTVWQSDNDDDGNARVSPSTTSWKAATSWLHRPQRLKLGPATCRTYAGHLQRPDQAGGPLAPALAQPGVVPNLLNTGQGSPCGIIVYEGDLLPEIYRGALLHCDAGPNVVRAYVTKFGTFRPAGIAKPVSADEALKWKNEGEAQGGGYEAKEVEIVEAHQAQDRGDRWFRPDDLCVAPDGAVYISDWYDPGVGGHQTADTGLKQPAQPGGWTRGSMAASTDSRQKVTGTRHDPSDGYERSARPDRRPEFPQSRPAATGFGYTKLAEAIKANNAEAAHRTQRAVHRRQESATSRRRALWLLGRNGEGNLAVQLAIKDKDPDIRITGIRVARQMKERHGRHRQPDARRFIHGCSPRAVSGDAIRPDGKGDAGHPQVGRQVRWKGSLVSRSVGHRLQRAPRRKYLPLTKKITSRTISSRRTLPGA